MGCSLVILTIPCGMHPYCVMALYLHLYTSSYLATFLIVCFLPICFAISKPLYPDTSHLRSSWASSDLSTTQLSPRAIWDTESHVGSVPYGVRLYPLSLFSPVIAAAGFAESFYAQVMAQALERIEDGAGRFAELIFTKGEVFMSFKGLTRPIVDWEMVYEFAKWMRDRARLGLVGIYRGRIWSKSNMHTVEILFGIVGMDE